MPRNRNLPIQLLVIDDSSENLELIQASLQDDGLAINTAGDPEEGLKLFQHVRPQIVLLDLVMPKMTGMQVLERIVEIDAATDVILMTAHYSPESAVEAIQKGACDYLTKPLDIEKLRTRVASLRADAERRQRALQLDRELVETFQFEGIIGRSPLILEVFAKIRRVAPHFRTVLVTGATGTGKELVARALQRLSPVASKPFVVCNCAALVDTLLESELFGYMKGSFTGANQDKVGIFEYADGGTVFLDEIGEMALPAQAKLLRVLQNQEVQRIGSPIPRKVDVRVIAATNRNPRDLIKDGHFREDLYYRLGMVEIPVPCLSDRREDLPLLQRYFLEKFSAQYGKTVKGITRQAQTKLAGYAWPGNVRELENVIGNACMMADGELIEAVELPGLLHTSKADDASQPEDGLVSLEELQHRHVLKVLQQVGGNKARAAEILGIGRATLYEMLARMKNAQPQNPTEKKRTAVAGQ